MTAERAAESHRTDEVDRPQEEPARPSRFATLKRAWTAAKEDRLPLIAAGVAFYAFLSIIPALIAAVLIYGLVSDPAQVTEQVDTYASALPTSAQELLTEQMTTLAEAPRRSLSIGLVIAIVLAFWSASNGTANMIMAVNHAYGGEQDRGFVKRRAMALLFTVGAIVFVVVAVALVAAVPPILDALDLPGWANIVVQIARWIFLLLAVLTALSVLYRWAPEHGSGRWQWLSFGAIVATLIWAVVSVGFSIYVDYFGNYAQTYGSLAGVAVLLLWLWLSAYAALFGAEINAETLQHSEPERHRENADAPAE
ncbi:MAG TPA: YihY/virulence factor BrkB family protein [Jiangellaceae bacterium]|nr:YihY/virulence factor BrkB family protein [Jiangellaceae bacterium]